MTLDKWRCQPDDYTADDSMSEDSGPFVCSRCHQTGVPGTVTAEGYGGLCTACGNYIRGFSPDPLDMARIAFASSARYLPIGTAPLDPSRMRRLLGSG